MNKADEGGDDKVGAGATAWPCHVCGTDTTTSCSGCNVVFYCKISCQKKHRAVHKSFCKAVGRVTASSSSTGGAHDTDCDAKEDKKVPPGKVLIVNGLGACQLRDPYLTNESISQYDPLTNRSFKAPTNEGTLAEIIERAGGQVTVVDSHHSRTGANFDIFAQVGVALAKRRFAACIVVGLGSGVTTADFFTAPRFKDQLQCWVEHDGGIFLYHGERAPVADTAAWFGKTWTYSNYC